MKRKLNSDALVARSEVYLTAHTKRDNIVQYPELAEKIMVIESQKDRGVARGEVVAVDPNTLIHDVLLGDGFYKILLSKVMKPRTPLSKDDGYSEDLGDVGEGAYVAWVIWCLEKLVMLYLKEEDEKKIGDFERQVRYSDRVKAEIERMDRLEFDDLEMDEEERYNIKLESGLYSLQQKLSKRDVRDVLQVMDIGCCSSCCPLRVLLCLQWQKEKGNTLYIIVQIEDPASITRTKKQS
ncbi:hypothetical protein GIB67_037864 [Kingdonia uniflora]|uniref:Uncharacterized protein n=1 Tax=Kingdonia uniflora TaxID=39325 RepID=A0A7J7LGV7_9MAGN|nr:hypothetical protein GIB67_037864 [Kingdonia uniflora]